MVKHPQDVGALRPAERDQGRLCWLPLRSRQQIGSMQYFCHFLHSALYITFSGRRNFYDAVMVQNGRDCTPLHPKGIQARILLTSVFGPYAPDDEYGSRALNPIEHYHNQIPREQGNFLLPMSPLVGTDADPAEHLSPEHPARHPTRETTSTTRFHTARIFTSSCCTRRCQRLRCITK